MSSRAMPAETLIPKAFLLITFEQFHLFIRTFPYDFLGFINRERSIRFVKIFNIYNFHYGFMVILSCWNKQKNHQYQCCHTSVR